MSIARFKVEGSRAEGFIITKAPSMLPIDGKPVLMPTAEQYETLGYYPMEGNEAERIEGKTARLADYQLVNGKWHIVWEYDDIEPSPQTPIVISKYKAESALFAMGKLDALDALIDSQTITNEHGQTMTLRRMYNTALTFSTADANFQRYAEVVRQALQIGEEEWTAMLESCRED